MSLPGVAKISSHNIWEYRPGDLLHSAGFSVFKTAFSERACRMTNSAKGGALCFTDRYTTTATAATTTTGYFLYGAVL